MKYRGVVYDVGLKFTDAGFSVEPFDPALVNYDMRAIANDLHATSSLSRAASIPSSVAGSFLGIL